MIWVKTEAGRAEMQARAVVKGRALRNLLLLVDGSKSQAALLQGLVGVTPDDFVRLEALGLIAPLAPSPRATGGAARPAPDAVSPLPADPAPMDYAGFTATLTQLISKELGLRGLMMTLAVEKAGTIEELRAVGDKVIAQIADRRGEAAAAAARRALYGG